MAIDGCSLALNLLTAARIEVDWETERVVSVVPPFVGGGRRVPVAVGTGTTSKGLRSRGGGGTGADKRGNRNLSRR